MNVKKTIVILLAFVGLECFAQVGAEFEKYKNERLAQEQNWIQAREKEYEDYVKAENEAYANFVKEMSVIWGNGNVVESTNKDWVEYTNGGKTRSIVDFEQGRATVEIVTTPGKPVDKEQLKQGVTELILSKGKTKDYNTSVEKAEDLSAAPILLGEVETPSGKVINANNVNEGVNDIMKSAQVEVKTVTAPDGSERQVASISFNLIPEHIRVRAEKFSDNIKRYCVKYEVEEPLAYAIMQTESSFNPKAKSHVPAYGLMQIVPSSAGADCAQSLKKNFRKPTANYLYDPENNIEMGVHYIYLLRNRYFKDVTDKKKQDLCIIASYNTGAGNLARALRGDTNIKKAIPKINEMSYDELFSFLKRNLHKETQNYIVKVTERTENFRKWIK